MSVGKLTVVGAAMKRSTKSIPFDLVAGLRSKSSDEIPYRLELIDKYEAGVKLVAVDDRITVTGAALRIQRNNFAETNAVVNGVTQTTVFFDAQRDVGMDMDVLSGEPHKPSFSGRGAVFSEPLKHARQTSACCPAVGQLIS
jgi:hypothetical protein